MAIEQFWGTGRRKTSVARVRIIPGGEAGVTVNKKPIQEYFDRADHSQVAQRPIEHVEKGGEYAVHVNVKGGGKTGQAGAISHGTRTRTHQSRRILEGFVEKGWVFDARFENGREEEVRAERRTGTLPILQTLELSHPSHVYKI